jgi:hypothetical protein
MVYNATKNRQTAEEIIVPGSGTGEIAIKIAFYRKVPKEG